MSRGRQKRVEKAQERRQESKKTKVRKEIRSTYKSLVHNQLFPLLNKINFNVKAKNRAENQTCQIHVLHVWVDLLPSSRELNTLHEDIDEEEISKRSKTNKTKGGAASPALKKAHPRSSGESSGDVLRSVSEGDASMLCRSYFFTGQCPGFKVGKSKKSGPICSHTHYTLKQLRLVDVIKSEKSSQNDDRISAIAGTALERASHAAALSQINLDGTTGSNRLDVDKVEGIEMLHHMEISIASTTDESVSEILSKTLVSEKVPISGIAYVSYCNMLIFDRFDGGVVLDKETEMKLCADKKGQSDARRGEGNIINLSGYILELILKYLPDVYCGILRSICTTFYNEIGTHSPALWKYLLSRNGWPVIDDADNGAAKNLTTICKNLFTSHYTVCHRVESFSRCVCKVLRNDGDHYGTKDSTAIKLNRCGFDYNKVAFWDESCVLLTSRNNCVLNLYHVTEQNSKHICKQTLEVRVAPVAMSKKCSCELDSFAMDDRYIVFSYVVEGSSVVTSMVKEDLLTHSMEESIMSGEILQSHDVTCKFKEYLDGSGRDRYMNNSFPNRTSNQEYDVFINGDVHACGNGAFCAIVEIQPKNNHVIDTEDFVSGILTFSASRGREFILDYIQLPGAIDSNSVLLCTNYQRKKKMEPSEVICKDWRTAALYLVLVDRNGAFQQNRILWEGWDVTDNLEFQESLFLGNDDRSKGSFKTLNGRSHVATSYLLSLSSRPESFFKRVMIMMQGKELNSILSTILLRDSYSKVLWMKFMGEDYLVICACYSLKVTSQSSECVDETALVVIHIPAMIEIYRYDIQNSKLPGIDDGTIPIIAHVSKNGAMAAVVGDMGLCVTGAMTSHQTEEKTSKARKAKMKKRLVAKTGKGGNKRLGTGLVKL